MAGIKFPFKDIVPLLELSIGMAKRIDENRAESMTVLYCNFKDFSDELISASLGHVLRGSDAIVNHGSHYFFILQYTDKYGATIVKDIFEEFFASYIESVMVSYPLDGENAFELLENMQDSISTYHSDDLKFLDKDELLGTKK